MADQEDGRGPSASIFPNPPTYFFADFTPEKLGRAEELRKAHAGQTGTQPSAASRLPGLPDELEHLQPPPEPVDGAWRILGDRYTLEDALPTLEAQGIQRLGRDVPEASAGKDGKRLDTALELKKLAKSLLLNFLELTGILYESPGDAAEKLEDIRTLFINMHHNINAWRPHQTREALITLLQTQLERTQNETKALREVTESARRLIEGLGSEEAQGNGALPRPEDPDTGGGGGGGSSAKQAQRPREAEVWASLDSLFD